MKKLILLLALLPNLLLANQAEKIAVQISKTKSKIDTKLKANEAIYEFQFVDMGNTPIEADVHYSIDGSNHEQRTNGGTITIRSTPGKHVFQFFYNAYYYEVYSDPLEINAGYHDTYQVNLFQAEVEVMKEKPVIYLYPKEATDVTVKMDIRGENAFFYPAYNDQWKFTAQPTGDLVFGDKTYNYLFWEATQRTILSPQQTASGFFVEGKNAVDFLEDKLTKAGLNSKEQADFITYWGPRLAQNELNFVHFEFNETCNKYAELNISPKPDHIYRIFMTWGAVSEEFEVKEQEMKAFDRSGFSVLEWGGQEANIKKSFIVN